MANRLLTIDGNIGSGKTTLLAKLKEKYADDKDIIFLREPVDEWESIKNEEGTSMLQLFYGDQEKYSFPFQMMAFISRYALLKDAMKNNSGKFIFTERSLFTDKFVFAKMLHDMRKIEGVNYQIYNKWFDTFSVDYPVHHCIYVKTEPEICHERIMKRSRTGEDSIPLDYLTSCNKYHDEMITSISHMFENPQEDIIELNGNVDIFLNPEEMEEWLNKIDRLIYI